MQATMLPFPYSSSRPSFVDMGESIKSSPSGTPSPPAVAYPSRFESFLAGGNGRSMWHSTSYGQTQFELAQFTSDPFLVKQNYVARKKSFTIEAILGLNGYDEGSCGKPERERPRSTRVTDTRRQERLQTAAPYGVPTATPRSALPAHYSTKENKSTTHHVSSEGLSCQDMSDRLSNPPNNSSSGTVASSLPTPGTEPRKPTSSAGKAKRIRTIFTPEQLERLETEFERQQYMVGPERLYLASALNLTEAQVKVWFQNRRIKWRKQHLEMQHARLAQLREVESVESSETETEPQLLTEESTHSPSCLADVI